VLQGVRQGDSEAMGVLFEACFDDLYGLAFRMLGNHAAAEDAMQEVFLKLHRGAGSLDPARDPRPWLRTITANHCRDHWRSFGAKVTRHATPVDESDEGMQLPDGGPAPDSGTLAAEQAALVQRALDQLAPPDREVVVLRDYEGLDHGTIAEMLGVSGAAVRKRYSRALSRLGELLRDVES
jgi:RNA polymerase sigma-70 factor (ECF subfamily)